jgi:hemoglobin
MEIFNSVCDEFELSADVTGDLNALMISMEFDCVVQPGENVPCNPGPAQPRGNSLYARCGGVYPLALFVDRLVDALLQDERVVLPCDGQKRNEASLKYLFTEVVCNICGGPEVITARSFEETMLLLPKAAWEIFIATAQLAADHLPTAVRAELVQCLQRSKALIVDPHSNGGVLPNSTLSRSGGQTAGNVKSLQAAASGKMLTSAAIAARHAAPGAHVDARRRVMGDPRTLYGRGGGVFGLAKLADSLMDKWMANATLNANAAVSHWHESQQKFGFKFLVTQLLGYLTGGPQRYTGVPMDVAHKHLAITSAQWSTFMADASSVFQNLGVDANTQSELLAILASFQDQCVLKHGERAPADPGMCRARPSGNSAYSQLGGVYPIALFADRLVEKVLQGDRLQVQWNPINDRSGTRHPPGLKYMVTELLCHNAGGPEMPTSKGFEEAKLGIDPNAWSVFLGIVEESASIWPTKHHRDLMVKICEKCKVEICCGLEGQDMPNSDGPIVSEGDKFVFQGRCPFSGKAGGKCPISGSVLVPDSATIRPAQARNETVSSHTLPVSGSSQMNDAVNETVHAPMGGRILGSALQQKLDKLMEEDPDLCCPVSLMVFSNPVIASDGFMYDQASLQQLLANRLASPMTREVLKSEYRLAQTKKAEVTVFRKQRCQELLAFAEEAVSEQQQLALTALERVCEYVSGFDKKDRNNLQTRSLIAKAAAPLYGRLGHPVPMTLS